MYEILFYRDRKGNQPLLEYLKELSLKKDKDSRINFNKINDYIQALSEFGLALNEPYIKHIDGEIWELRPLRNRIFFVVWVDQKFILLHHFTKKTNKTPKREIEKARKELKEIKEGYDE